MPATRIGNFIGDDLAYAKYLCDTLLKCINELPLADRIPLLEEQVKSHQSTHQSTSSLHVELWSPPKQPSPSTSTTSGAWRKKTTKFFENIPGTEDEWHTKREMACLSNADGILRIVDYLATGRRGYNSDFTNHSTEGGSETKLSAFGRNVGLCLVIDKNHVVASRFLSLVFLAACQVAIYQGHSKQEVESAQREFLRASRNGGECRAESETLADDRTAVFWLIGEMERQTRRGLQHRAFEIFYLAGKTINFYKNCPRNPEENQQFTGRIPLCNTPEEIQASLPLWIPFFIATNFEEWNYSTICEALGTTILNTDEDFRHFRETHQSRKIGVCRVQAFLGLIPCPKESRKRRNHVPKNPRPRGRNPTVTHDTQYGTGAKSQVVGDAVVVQIPG
ncbi:hypothetical protein V8F33_009025 [Rhypophila sp. PSN 637]